MAKTTSTPDEEWRAIPGHDGYEASSLGRIRSIARTIIVNAPGGAYTRRVRGRVLVPWLAGEGYLYVSLGASSKKGVHRLIALAFQGEPPSSGHHAAHRDGVRTRNVSDNVRWASPEENARDKIAHGTMYGRTGAKGVRHANARFTDDDVRHIREIYSGNRGELTAIAERFGVSRSTIGRICSKSSWSHIE